MNEDILIRGAGDLATGIGHRLHRSGFKVIMLDIVKPTVIRRTVSYAQAIYDGAITIEGVEGVRVETKEDIVKAWENGKIAVKVDESGKIIEELNSKIVIDAIIAKKNVGTSLNMADIVIGVGPGFTVGKDVDLIVETQRGHFLGKVLEEGSAIPNTGVPGKIGGYDVERVIYSPAAGTIKHSFKIGDMVKTGDTIARVGDVEIEAEISGVLRGLIQENLDIVKGLKIADIDARGNVDHCFSISDKARSVAGGVLEAIMYKTKGK